MKINIPRALVALTVPAALVLSACGGAATAQPEAASSAAPSPSATATPTLTPTPTVAGYATAAALRAAAVSAGLPCDEWAPAEPDEYDEFIEGGECWYKEEYSRLEVFATAAEAGEDVKMLTDDSTWEHPFIFADNWVISPSGDLTKAELTATASRLGASLYTQDPKDKKRYAAIAKRAKKVERFGKWEKNVGSKNLMSYYDRSEAVVEVCGTLIDAGGIDAGYDDAASDFESNLDTDEIESWSPNPEATIDSFSGSFVELVWTTDVCGVNLDG